MYISRSTILWYVIPILLFFAAVFIFFGKPLDLTAAHFERTDDLLTPNTPLQLLPGERYSYVMSVFDLALGNRTINETFVVVGASQGLSPAGCVLISGTLDAPDGSFASSICIHQNGSLTNPNATVDLFQPWMLSVSEGWSWSSRISLIYPQPAEASDITTLSYSYAGAEQKFGRNAFKVISTAKRTFDGRVLSSTSSILWIDAEKRVLLAVESDSLSGRLVSAPFPLANGAAAMENQTV